MRLTGRYHQDYLYFNDVFNASDKGKSVDDFFVRRFHVGVTGLIAANWEYNIQAIYNNRAATGFSDFYITYMHPESSVWWRFGKQKEPMGLERLTSSNSTIAQEVSAATQAFSPGSNIGVLMHSIQKTRFLSLGIFDDNNANNRADFNVAITGRAVEVLWHRDDDVFHLGFAASFRQGEQSSINANPEVSKVNSVDKVSSGQFDVDSSQIFNVESLYLRGRFSVLSELYLADYDGVENNQGAMINSSMRLKGGYITVSYFLTPDTRPYNWKVGGVGSIKSQQPGGAWEVFSRASYIDLNDNHRGNKASIYTLGMSWYIDSNWRAMLSLVHADYDRPPAAHSELGYDLLGSETRGDAVSARVQFYF